MRSRSSRGGVAAVSERERGETSWQEWERDTSLLTSLTRQSFGQGDSEVSGSASVVAEQPFFFSLSEAVLSDPRVVRNTRSAHWMAHNAYPADEEKRKKTQSKTRDAPLPSAPPSRVPEPDYNAIEQVSRHGTRVIAVE